MLYFFKQTGCVCLFVFRLMEAFVSIQLEKVSLRDEMVNSFLKKSQALRGIVLAAVSGATCDWLSAMKCMSKFSLIMINYERIKYLSIYLSSLKSQEEAAAVKQGLVVDFVRK